MTEGKREPPASRAVSQLLRREIQAPIAACLIREFAATVGDGRALEIAANAIRADAAAAGQSLARQYPGPALAASSW